MSMNFYPVQQTGPKHWAMVSGAPSVNVSSSNATLLLRVLGYDLEDAWLLLEASDLEARCRHELMRLMALPSLDQGTAWTESQSGRWNEGGRSEGYLAERIQSILEVAEFAGQNSYSVSVG